MVILTGFPQPPAAVEFALHQLALLRDGDAEELALIGDLDELPRPWEPASCPPELRAAVWQWCDAVATWLNTDYGWRPAQLIPTCWPQHPHIARELAVTASLRWQAEQATGPHLLEDWQRYTYPMFCDRMAGRLGESTCRTGAHQDWPAAGRVHAFTSPAARTDRHRLLRADTG